MCVCVSSFDGKKLFFAGKRGQQVSFKPRSLLVDFFGPLNVNFPGESLLVDFPFFSKEKAPRTLQSTLTENEQKL